MNDAHDDPRDPKLSRLYGQASQAEPPPALDTAILAAARATAASQRLRLPWWRRQQAPLALAASVVLAVILTLSMDRNPPPDGEIPASKSNKAPAPAAEQAAPARANAVDAQSAGGPALKHLPAAAPTPQPATNSQEVAPAMSPTAVADKPAASAAQGMPTPAAETGSADKIGNEQRGAGAKPAAAALEAKREAAAPMPSAKPEAWIEEIRSLRRQGHPADAERSLREFRAAYPSYALPEDLR
jgi:hypothetical protein